MTLVHVAGTNAVLDATGTRPIFDGNYAFNGAGVGVTVSGTPGLCGDVCASYEDGGATAHLAVSPVVRASRN